MPIPAATSNKLRIRVSKRLYASLCEMFQLTRFGGDAGSLEVFAGELLESCAAEFRLRKLCAASPLAPKSESAPPQTNDVHRVKLRPAAIQRLLHLATEMSVSELARRFRVSTTHVRLILQRHQNGAHVEVPGRSQGRGSEWRRFSIGGNQ